MARAAAAAAAEDQAGESGDPCVLDGRRPSREPFAAAGEFWVGGGFQTESPRVQAQVSAVGASPARLGRRGPSVGGAASSRLRAPGPRRLGPRDAAALAVGRAGLGGQRALAARAEGCRHGHQVGGAGRQALQRGAVAARGHLHALDRKSVV